MTVLPHGPLYAWWGAVSARLLCQGDRVAMRGVEVGVGARGLRLLERKEAGTGSALHAQQRIVDHCESKYGWEYGH